MLSTDIWGPGYWRFIHTIAETYHGGEKQREAVHSFFLGLIHLLPCAVCASHYGKYLAEHYMELNSALASTDNKLLLDWVIDLHNSVNRNTNKPVLTAGQSYDAHWKLVTQGQFTANKLDMKTLFALFFGSIILFFVVKEWMN